MISPCKDCTERFPGCHSSCQLYGKFREACDKRREERNRQTPTNDYLVETFFKTQKRAHRRRK